MVEAFAQTLQRGQLGESIIAQWLRERGTSVLPAYEKEIDTGKGPRLFLPEGQLVTPDLFVFPAMEFIEAKHKSVFSWHHRTQQWCTGIDLNHYRDYQEVQKQTESRVWLFFLHRESTPNPIDSRGRKDCSQCTRSERGTCCPPECPTGLFGASLAHLVRREHHRHKRHGRHGMVYWAEDAFRLLADIDELQFGPLRAQ